MNNNLFGALELLVLFGFLILLSILAYCCHREQNLDIHKLKLLQALHNPHHREEYLQQLQEKLETVKLLQQNPGPYGTDQIERQMKILQQEKFYLQV